MTECSAKIWKDAWHKGGCSNPATIERDGKPYCAIHDPEYIKAKETKRQARYEANSCRCGYHFLEDFYRYCPLCGVKRIKEVS